MKRLLLALLLLALAPLVRAQGGAPAPVERDFVVRDFVFASGETLPEVKLHYRTIGEPREDADGVVRNGILILHGTGGSGAQFLRKEWAERLYGAGQPFDASRWFLVLPDNLGHGGSSKPSDGLRAKFPQYRYADMVRLQHRLVTEGLGLSHLHLVTGTSMGGMHTWMWGHTYPEFIDALVPLACNPVEIAGRNRVWRKALVDAIVTDPSWKNGDYTEPPRGMASAIALLLIAGGAPLEWQKQRPTRAAADAWLAEQIATRTRTTDANDLVWQVRASEDYDPAPHLDRITAPLLAINSADDFINPPELPMAETLAAKLKRGRFVLIPISDATRGHGTHTLAAVWQEDLAAFLATVRG
jgi:homoserine O-acetyltransferase/O-succinyltransferase